MEIRKATKDDIIHFLRMGRQFSDVADEPFDRESLTQHLEWLLDDSRTLVLLAFKGDQAVGMLAGMWFPTFWDHSKITATEMWWWVDPDHRKSGIGVALMDALESWATEVGAYRLSMMNIVGLAPGIEEVYRKRGFRPRENTFVKEL